ncbi:MAG: heavy-metal-associated domain-containing protein [Pseudomonadota bacterium]
MKTSVIEVGGMLSALSAHGVEKQLGKLRGVERAEVNYVSGSATVVYDETVIDLKTIKAKVHECGYHCSGELVPKHLYKPGNPPSEG